MTKLRAVFVAFAAIAVAGAGLASPASAQTAVTAASKVATTKLAAASLPGPGVSCAIDGSYEIAPVSSDVESAATSYVLIHVRRGEPVSSERISAQDLAQLRKLGCAVNERRLDGEAFVGG